MPKAYPDNETFFADLRGLIDAWCERRCLQPLGVILPAYNSYNGMTDGWGELLRALKTVSLLRDALLSDEQDVVSDLRHAAEDAISAR